jgi:acyl-CoA dehydrogenase
MDQLHGDRAARAPTPVPRSPIIKFCGAKAHLRSIIDRAIQIHGSLGYTTDLPLEAMYRNEPRLPASPTAPDEVHKQTLAKQLLKNVKPVGPWPSEHVPTRRAEAWKRFGKQIEAVRALR